MLTRKALPRPSETSQFALRPLAKNGVEYCFSASILLRTQLLSRKEHGNLVRHQVEQLRIGQFPKYDTQPCFSRGGAARRSEISYNVVHGQSLAGGSLSSLKVRPQFRWLYPIRLLSLPCQDPRRFFGSHHRLSDLRDGCGDVRSRRGRSCQRRRRHPAWSPTSRG
jgi:hypothetical protein